MQTTIDMLPTRASLTVAGQGRAAMPKDQVELLIKVSAGSTDGAEAAMARVMGACDGVEKRVRAAFSAPQGHGAGCGAESAMELSFDAPIGRPAVDAFMSTVSITTTTIVAGSGGGFFSSGPKTTTTTTDSLVIGGYTCSWGMLIVGTMRRDADPSNFASSVATLIDAVEGLHADTTLFPPPPPANGDVSSTNASKLGLTMDGYGLRYTLSDEGRAVLVAQARGRAHEAMVARTAEVAKGFGLAFSPTLSQHDSQNKSLRLTNVSEFFITSSSFADGDGQDTNANRQPAAGNYNLRSNGNTAIAAPDSVGKDGKAFVYAAEHDEERVCVVVVGTYGIQGGGGGVADLPTVVSFTAEGSVKPLAAGCGGVVAKLRGTLHAGRFTFTGKKKARRCGLAAAAALKELTASQETVLAAFREAAFDPTTTRIAFSAVPQFKRTASYGEQQYCGKTRKNGNNSDDSSSEDNNNNAPSGGEHFQATSNFTITVDTRGGEGEAGDKNLPRPIAGDYACVARVKEWLDRYLLSLREAAEGEGSSCSEASSAKNAKSAQKRKTTAVSVGEAVLTYHASDPDSAVDRDWAGAAARDAAIANANALAADYSRRVGGLVALHSFSDVEPLLGGAAESGGGVTLPELGGHAFWQQQQRASRKNMLSSASCSYWRAPDANLFLPHTKITWRGLVSFAFSAAPK